VVAVVYAEANALVIVTVCIPDEVLRLQVGVTVELDIVAEQALILTIYGYDGNTIVIYPPVGTFFTGVIVKVYVFPVVYVTKPSDVTVAIRTAGVGVKILVNVESSMG
jgi:hypothetical protein